MPHAPTDPLALAPDTWAVCHRLADTLRQRGWLLRTAESCTGGLVAAACTALAGSSDWFDRAHVTYSNTAKAEDLAVPPGLIRDHGAVSGPVAEATGGSPDKPVGTVWFAWSVAGRVWSERRCWPGDRAAVRAATVVHALWVLEAACAAEPLRS